ncbi:hypothetical protein COB64_03285 [Candidatus Wolfebacteria bacterium]|nr:MAG: hypothetical protein COB64_03285 [Candidatus Wolfebacteria bacterium]
MIKFFQKKIPMGIDISDHSIEVLQLNKKREIMAYGRAMLEEGIIRDGKILKKEELVAILKDLLKNSLTYANTSINKNNERPHVILSLPESKVFIHSFEVPLDIEGDELIKLISKKVSKIIPFNLEELYWDYTITQGKESQRVLYVGVIKEIADEYIDSMVLAGLEPKVIDIESISLQRALLPLNNEKATTMILDEVQVKDYMIVDIGARITAISVFDDSNIPRVSVTVPMAGNQFTTHIANKFKINYTEAEKIKRDLGFDYERKDNNAVSVLQESFQEIMEEIKHVITYYENESGHVLKKIILTGGSALIPNVDEYVSVNLEKPVVIGDPLLHIKDKKILDRNYHPLLFANVIGLALRGVTDVSPRINLLSDLHHLE